MQDVLCNMSGIFRDSFQNVVELLDDLFQVLEAVVHTCLTCMLQFDVGLSVKAGQQ